MHDPQSSCNTYVSCFARVEDVDKSLERGEIVPLK